MYLTPRGPPENSVISLYTNVKYNMTVNIHVYSLNSFFFTIYILFLMRIWYEYDSGS